MKIEIDQSIKIENTSKTSYIAFSNSVIGVVSITSREKKKIETYFRKTGKRKLFTIITFSIALFLLIKDHLTNNASIIIDSEYPGYEKFIARKLAELISQNTIIENCRISSAQIGKKSGAHIVAYSAYKKRKGFKAVQLGAKEIIEVMKENNKKSGIV